MVDESITTIQSAALQTWSEAKAVLPDGKHLEERYGIPAEVVLPAIAALLLMGCALLCCCLRGKGDVRDPLLPKHISRSDLIRSNVPTQGEVKSVSAVAAEQDGWRCGRSDLIRADAPQLAPQEEAKSVTVVVAEQEGGRGGGWGDLDGFDPSITINRQEHPTARRGAALSQYFESEAPKVARRGGAAPPANKRAMARGWGSGRKG